MTSPAIEKKQTTAAELITNFQNVSVSLSNIVVADNLYLTKDNYITEKLFLKDILFKGQVFFKNCDIKDGIKFLNCEFDDLLVFRECITNKSDFKFLPGDKSIEFVNCKIRNQIDIRFSKFEGGLVFNNTFIEKAFFEQIIVFNGGGLEFRNKTSLNHSIWVSNCNFLKGGVRFAESVINGHLRFENITIGTYDFTFSKFSKNIFIWAGFCRSFTFYQSQFEDDFNIQAVKVTDELSVIECDFKKLFRIELDEKNGNKQGIINHLYLSQTNFLDTLSLTQFSEKKAAIDKITVNFKNLTGSFHFDDLLIKQLNISGFNKDSRLVLNNVILNGLWLDKFRNSGSIDFINVRPDRTNSKIRFISSILGSFAFINCKLNAYQKFEIRDSIFDQVVSSGTKWFDYNQISGKAKSRNRRWQDILSLYTSIFFRTLKNPKLKLKKWLNSQLFNIKMLYNNLFQENNEVKRLYQIREIFRQLKVSMNKQGNRIQGLFFQSQEFTTYEKELKLTHQIWTPERLILWSNQSNNHGQNWIKPLFLGVLFTFLWFIFMVISMNPNLELRLPWNCNFLATYYIYSDYFKGIPDLFNPTFRLDLVFPAQSNAFTFATYFWALIQRISISYFIFQTISAFRKYMK